MFPVIRIVGSMTLIAGISLGACVPSGSMESGTSSSDSQAYTPQHFRSNYENSLAKAELAVSLLEDAGWCEIPQRYLPYGMDHSELVRYMACTANGESTLGKYKTNYGAKTAYGRAHGFWQVVEGHLGKSVNVDGKVYSCPAGTVTSLINSDLSAAKCALYVYMERSKWDKGLNAWKYSACKEPSTRNVKRTDGSLVFRPACQNRACQQKPAIAFREDMGEVRVNLDSKCDADSIRFVFVKSDGSKLVPPQGNSVRSEELIRVVGGEALVSYAAAQQLGYDAVRVIVEKGGRELYRTNPSPRMPMATPKPVKQAIDDTHGESSESAMEGSGTHGSMDSAATSAIATSRPSALKKDSTQAGCDQDTSGMSNLAKALASVSCGN